MMSDLGYKLILFLFLLTLCGNVARQIYERVMNMVKGNEKPKVEIKTSNVALNGLLNWVASLGKGQGERASAQAA